MLNSRSHVPLKSGELLVCREPQLISTVLGSCVSVTMFVEHLPMAAICHAMLPEPRRGHDAAEVASDNFRYMSHAIPAMLKAFERAGVELEEIEVKMFGGGNVIGVGGEEELESGVGAANISMARHLLRQQHLRIKASNVGGLRGRKIFFDTGTGEVFHKYLTSTIRQES